MPASTSRRRFLRTGAAGLAATTLAACRTAAPAGLQTLVGDGRKRRILLRGGVVLSLDPKVGDFERADVLVDGKTIAAVGPKVDAGDAEVVDCAGTIVMPGFVTTHHHQYETIQRSIIPDGVLAQPWPQESYQSVVQAIWTAGRVADPADPSRIVWDLGRHPYDPEDCYISMLVACLSEMTQGITCGTDTSQSNHTPEHTDALIKGLMDSGRRTVFAYSAGIDRRADGYAFEAPGTMGDTTKGIGRLAKTYFSSRDQLVTLGFGGGGGPAFPGAPYTGWQLARSFGATIHNHAVGNPAFMLEIAADARNGTDWSDITFIHGTRWNEQVWQIIRDRRAHISIANLIEMQMRHGMPPFQDALDHGILPSLSPDVDTNMTTDPFSLMRGAFCLQRALANDLAFPETNPGKRPAPQLLTSRQVIEMATIAGAASGRLLDKVGTLTPGKEADIVVLEARSLSTWPMNNVPGTVVTMMNPTHVRDVLIAGRVVVWKHALVGWDVDRLLRQVEESRDRVLARIQAPAKVGKLPKGNNGAGDAYQPNFMGSCCYNGQNPTATAYALRP